MGNDYVFDHAWDQERERLAGLEWALDPGTARHLDALGLEPGWRCLEAGAGGGSMATWLARRVQPGGQVVATDLDLRYLGALAGPGLEVRRHDLVADALPAEEFDLAHARWLLHWLADPQPALASLRGALRPGGWILVEEPNGATVAAVEPFVARRVVATWLEVLTEMSGVHLDLGRQLPGRLRAAGFEAVDGEGRVSVLTGGSPLATFLRLGIAKVRPALEASGAVTPPEIDEVLALLDDPGYSTLFVATVAAWGRRPGR